MKNDHIIRLLLSNLHLAVYTAPLYANVLTCRLPLDCTSSPSTVHPFITGFEWIIILITGSHLRCFRGGGGGVGGSLLTVSLKRGAWAEERRGLLCASWRCLPVAAASGLTLRRACPCFSAEIQRNLKAPILRLRQTLITARIHGWT